MFQVILISLITGLFKIIRLVDQREKIKIKKKFLSKVNHTKSVTKIYISVFFSEIFDA